MAVISNAAILNAIQHIKRRWPRWAYSIISVLVIVLLASRAWAQPQPMLLGLYTPGFPGDATVLREQVQAVDRWSGQQHSLVGLFYDLEAPNPAYDIPTVLNRLQENGYTAFINFTARHTASEIANGDIDEAIAKIAQAYSHWAQQAETPVVFMAPLPEMNGAWEIYGHTPEDFKQAYTRIQSIFAAADIPAAAIRWVFAPNGWSVTEHGFERYYPGDSAVDVVSFSAYNWGHCRNAAWKQWQSPQTVFGPYIARMQQMAPRKPLFIAQTASTSAQPTGRNASDKDHWLTSAYRYLAASGVRAVMYFNLEKECDWAVFDDGPTAAGYQQAATLSGVGYQSPIELAESVAAAN